MDVLNQIGIRWQLVLAQLVGFLLIFAVLKHFLFGRVQQVLDDRAADEERRKHAIASGRKDADAARSKLDARRAEIEKTAYEQTQAEVRAGQKRRSEIVGAAIDRAREEVTAARHDIATARAKALARMEEDVVALTVFVAGRTTGRKLEDDSAAEQAVKREVDALLAARGGAS